MARKTYSLTILWFIDFVPEHNLMANPSQFWYQVMKVRFSSSNPPATPIYYRDSHASLGELGFDSETELDRKALIE